jgi:malate dehydrogenase (oxaloacetate-decarboxylating)
MQTDNSSPVLHIGLHGPALLNSARLNKGSAFSEQERIAFGLEGLLPHHVSTLEEQKARVLANFRAEATPLSKYMYLRALQDRNETLFYAALLENLPEMMPIVYTPTVAQAVEEFSHIFESARGLYITPEDINRMELVFANAPCEQVAVAVCTDNEGILGIGDQGTGGMAIPIGKLALYVAAGGFRPEHCLPICLDVGTENQRLLDDPLYLGLKAPRLRGAEYHAFIDAFVRGFKAACPEAVLQWEDFSRDIAFDNMMRYRDELPSFNDDIQGTAAVTAAALMGAARLAQRPFRDEVICLVGAGCAGIGVAQGIVTALVEEGLSPEEAQTRVLVFDSKGLLVDDRTDLPGYKRLMAVPAAHVAGWKGRSLHEVIEQVRPTALVGLTGHPGAIDASLAQLMAKVCERPAIFPMSNPTANAEAVPADLLQWTDGRAIIATGSPFAPVQRGNMIHEFSQANNVYIFPGVGFGAYVCGARAITATMLAAAARRLHSLTEPEDYARGLVLPPVQDLRAVSSQVGAAVCDAAAREGLAKTPVAGDVVAALSDRMYVPQYLRYVRA